jgi:hypothetical protein
MFSCTPRRCNHQSTPGAAAAHAMTRLAAIVAVISALALPTSHAAAQPDSLSLVSQAYVRITNGAAITPQQFTVEAWFRADGPGYGNSNDAGGAIIVGKPREGAAGGLILSWVLTWSAQNQHVRFLLTHQYDAQGQLLESTAVVPQGSSRHVAVTFDGTTIRMYLDGVLDSSVPFGFSGVYYSPAEPVLIGAANYCCGFLRRWQGLIDDVRIWDSARSAAQIAAGIACEAAGNEPGLIAAWSFTDGLLIDRTGHGYDGVAQAAPVMFNREFTLQPTSAETCSSGTVPFSVSTTTPRAGPFTYQWQLQTAPGVWQGLGSDPLPLPCGGSAFATQPFSRQTSIGIRPCTAAPGAPQHFQVRCVVSDSCGTVTTNEAAYSICPADMNCDGTLNVQDFLAYLQLYATADPRANFNADPQINVQDFLAFLAAYAAGC